MWETTPCRRIVAGMRRDIGAGLYPPGAAIPSYSQLADAYGTSVRTAQRAVAELRALGLVVGRQGTGVFVKDGDDASEPSACACKCHVVGS